MAQQTSTSNSGVQRPALLDTLTTTQMSELEEQISENDRKGFDTRAEAWGWSKQQTDEIWSWMEGQQPRR